MKVWVSIIISFFVVTDLSAELELRRFVLNPAVFQIQEEPLTVEEPSRLELQRARIGILDLVNILSEEGLEIIQEPNESVEEEGRFIGPLLNFPNPFSFSRETTVIGYRLVGTMDVELRLYSMTGQLVTQQFYYKDNADPGTQSGYQTIEVDDDFLDGRELTPGIYFYVLISDGQVLAKEKMAVLP